jgi:hypothetical protein
MKTSLSFILLLLVFVVCQSAMAVGKQRAIVIGIDTYDPKGLRGRWINLDGCANDAQAVKQVLEARYGFPDENIKVLLNGDATRVNILNSFNDLLSGCDKGDIAVIYYAGHGSQVKNSLSEEKDMKDETMVPADSYLGSPDIRDKELAVVFNKFADKGVLLTILYDCCHSGSIGRGSVSDNPPKLRHIEEDLTLDAKDPSISTPPEKRGVLIMSASQDFEFASEQIDENGTPHGAFTIALLQTLSTLPVNSSSSDIFSSIRAIMKYNGKKQEPVLAATEERKSLTLFGIDKGALNGKTMVAVLGVKNNDVILQGGFTIGVYPNSELSCKKGDVLVSVRVKTVDAINKCTASLTSGDISVVKPGDLFELKNWSMPAGSLLKVYIAPSPYSYEQLTAIAKDLEKLGAKKNVTIISDPVKIAPTHTVFYSDGKWFEGLPNNKVINLGANPDTKVILKNLPEGSKLYISLPPPNKLEALLKVGYLEENAVEAVNISSNAQYFLTGRMLDEKLEYAYFIPQISGSDSSFNNTLPLRTSYFPLENSENGLKSVADSLSEYSLRIAKIKAWLTLAPPPDDGSFPFRLAIKNSTSNKFVSGDEIVKVDDILGFYLELDKENQYSWDKTKRYIYVFSIDSKGKMSLWFPLSGSVENRAPWLDTEGNIIQFSPLGRSKLLRVTEPCGIDTYIMIATNEPIPNPEVLNQPGVLSRGAGGNSGFSQLLNIGTSTRGDLVTPSEWGIQKMVIKSVPK